MLPASPGECLTQIAESRSVRTAGRIPALAAGRAMVSSPTCVVDEPFNGFTAPFPLPLRYQMLRVRDAARSASAPHRVHLVRHAAARRLRPLARAAQAFRSRESAALALALP